MNLFRRTKSTVQAGPVVPFRQRVMDRMAMAAVAADEMAVSLDQSGIYVTGVFPSPDGVEILFADFDAVGTFLDGLFKGDLILAGGMQDRASEGCLTAWMEESLPGKLPSAGPPWGWEVHPSWEEGQRVWHIALSLPLDDALTAVSILNSKRHGDSL